MAKIFMLIGVPGSGKSTWIKNQKFDKSIVIASTDNHIEEYAKSVAKTYNEVFRDFVDQANTLMNKDIESAVSKNLDIVWDQTNTTSTARRKKLRKIPQHYERIAVVFATPIHEELQLRLSSRPDKHIPAAIMNTMIANFQNPTLDEGFSSIVLV